MAGVVETHDHWQRVYESKDPNEVSWFEPVPEASLRLIDSLALAPATAIVDMGGGASHLAAELINRGYEDVTVTDISEAALDRARAELGERAGEVTWTAGDVRSLEFGREYRPLARPGALSLLRRRGRPRGLSAGHAVAVRSQPRPGRDRDLRAGRAGLLQRDCRSSDTDPTGCPPSWATRSSSSAMSWSRTPPRPAASSSSCTRCSAGCRRGSAPGRAEAVRAPRSPELVDLGRLGLGKGHQQQLRDPVAGLRSRRSPRGRC